MQLLRAMSSRIGPNSSLSPIAAAPFRHGRAVAAGAQPGGRPM